MVSKPTKRADGEDFSRVVEESSENGGCFLQSVEEGIEQGEIAQRTGLD